MDTRAERAVADMLGGRWRPGLGMAALVAVMGAAGPLAAAAPAPCAPKAAKLHAAGTSVLPSLRGFAANTRSARAATGHGLTWRAVATYDEVNTVSDPDTVQVTVAAYANAKLAARAQGAAHPFVESGTKIVPVRVGGFRKSVRTFVGTSTYGVAGQNGVILTVFAQWRVGTLVSSASVQTQWGQVVNPKSERAQQQRIVLGMLRQAVAATAAAQAKAFVGCRAVV